MEDSLVENEDEYLEQDSLSSVSASRDSLIIEHHQEETEEKSTGNIRRGSYTLETSPEMSESIRNQRLMEPIYVQTDNHQPYKEQKFFEKAHKTDKSHMNNMSQSMYDRPLLHSGRSSILSSANNKLREEKIRLAKEEQERKQKHKIAVLGESEKMSQNVQKRKESEIQKKVEENKRKALERQHIVEERKERLAKAEEARRKTILKKLINNTSKKPSPQSSNGLMTMSCFGGFVNTRTKPGNKEVVHNRFINARPVSSTGKVIGFGSSTPRSICENTIKTNVENKKIPEAILLKCEMLSRPVSARMSDKMMSSVMSPQITNTLYIKPKRQSSFKEKKTIKEVPKSLTMTTSMIDFPSKNKPKVSTHTFSGTKSDASIKEEMRTSVVQPKRLVTDTKRIVLPETKSSTALSNHVKRNDETGNYRKTMQAKSGTFPRHMKKTKVDSHLDSDSIEEEVYVKRKEKRSPQSSAPEIMSQSHAMNVNATSEKNEHSIVIQPEESNSQTIRAIPTKDLSENDYKARIMENRRLAREKREKEREQLMKSEREKRHAEEIAAREIMEIERENSISIEETHLVTSNDDTLATEILEENEAGEDDEEAQLSEITETPSITQSEPVPQLNKIEDEKNERKKRLESIMSRIRKPNDESSSDGGVSPRRAMSPEPAELEPEINNITSTPAFRSALLQSMMNKGGRLSKIPSQSKDENGAELDYARSIMEDSKIFLNPNEEEINNSDCPQKRNTTTTEGSKEICKDDKAIVSTADREDCDGKEDSLSLNDHFDGRDCQNMNGVCPQSDKINTSSLSSTETEEEDNIKTHFEIDSMYNPANINPIVQETYVFQN